MDGKEGRNETHPRRSDAAPHRLPSSLVRRGEDVDVILGFFEELDLVLCERRDRNEERRSECRFDATRPSVERRKVVKKQKRSRKKEAHDSSNPKPSPWEPCTVS